MVLATDRKFAVEKPLSRLTTNEIRDQALENLAVSCASLDTVRVAGLLAAGVLEAYSLPDTSWLFLPVKVLRPVSSFPWSAKTITTISSDPIRPPPTLITIDLLLRESANDSNAHVISQILSPILSPF